MASLRRRSATCARKLVRLTREGGHRAAAFAVLVTACAVLPLSTGCSKKHTEAKGREPVFLFAVDGLEWRVMKPLLEKGKLPVMAGLMEKGTYGYLQSMQPALSAVIWTSVATGKAPGKHGIHHFVYERPGAGGGQRYRYYTSGHRLTKAFWNILGDYDRSVVCIGWWMTYPAEPIRGIMVSQTNTTRGLSSPHAALWKGSLLKGVEDQVYPTDLQNRVMGILEDVDANLDAILEETFGAFPHPPDEFGQLMWDQSAWAFRADATYVRVASDILESGEDFDLFAIYISGTDVAGHRFWRYAYPEEFMYPPDGDQIEDFGHMLEDCYAFADRAIGDMLERAGGDATVVIVSDHGMHAVNKGHVFRADDRPHDLNSANHPDAPPGVIIASGGPFKASGSAGSSPSALDLESLPTVGHVVDVLPTILALMGIPIGEDMDGKPLTGILDLEKLPPTGIRYVATHDTDQWLAGRQARMREAIDETERIDQLRSLGYIK